MKGFLELDTHFENFQEYLSPLGRDVFRLPDLAEVSLDLLSMGNYLSLLAPLLDALSPKRICEIGAYRGVSTRALADCAKKYGGELLVVDPAIEPATAVVKADFVHYFQMLSEEFLSISRNADVFFIDGDHNYEVVSTELRLMLEQQCHERYPILFMHDTGWPFAFRDLYYDVSRIHQPHQLSRDHVLKLTRPEVADLAISIQPVDDFALHEGGPRNGVRPAILDFLHANAGWKFIHLPSLYGLGVLWNGNHVQSNVAQELEKLEQLFARIFPFASILEFNRILLLSEMNRQGQVWKQDQEYIGVVNRRLTTAIEQIAHLQTLKGASKQVVKCIVARTKRIFSATPNQ